MDLNGPGTSLFQGNELNDFDNLAQREEEEEALEEQIRRDLELKSMLENAFDDVSFENDEESVFNGSPNRSASNHSSHNNSSSEFDGKHLKNGKVNGIVSELEKNCTNNQAVNFNATNKQSRTSLIKRVEFNGDSDNYTDQFRKKIQNGNLHDIVDASGGGGGDVPYSLHFNHCFQRSPLSEVANGVSKNVNDSSEKLNIIQEAHDSSEQLKILYDVRVREVHRLTEMIDSMRKEHEVAMGKLKHELAISQAEIERGNISQKQLQNLLAADKEELESTGKQIVALESEILKLESCKNELIIQLETNKLVINDLERKVLILEKGNKSCSEAVQYETNLKAIIEKHNFELKNLNSENEKITKENETLAKENNELKLKLNRLSQINDETIANKCEIINRLSKQIDETQKQCENLMKSSTAEDNLRLQMELKLLKEEKLTLTAKLEMLEKENSRQEEELRQYESVSKMSSFGSFGDSKDLDGSQVTGKLGEELYRALKGQKAKRQEIKNLQNQLEDKDKEIKLLMDSENVFKCEINNLQETISDHIKEIIKHKELLSTRETENEKLKAQIINLRKEIDLSEKEVGKLKEEVDSLRKNLVRANEEKTEMMKSNYAEEYLRFHSDALDRVREETEKTYKLELLRKDLENENLKKEIDDIKNLYVEVFSSKEALIKQLEKEKNSSGRSSVVDVDEVKRLQKELDKSRQRILELDQTLKQQYEQEVEILNLDINRLNLQLEKLKKEKDREESEKDKILIENELLKTEIEQITSEKNLLLLDFDKLKSDMEEIRKGEENRNEGLRDLREKHEAELKSLTDKYEVIVRKLKKEIELTLTKAVKSESKFTSPMKTRNHHVECQWSPPAAPETKTLPARPKSSVKDTCTSPVSAFRGNWRSDEARAVRHMSVATEPETNRLTRREVVEIMEKLGAHHENEMLSLENKYRSELARLDKKFQTEVEKARDAMRAEMERKHASDLERIIEKHKIELENRIEQEKKEAVADLITEWACEVQSLKASYAEAQTEMERMKMKYKAAKSVALQYKTYFKSKTEHMKEEWKRVEDGYEQALKELEKNVHHLVDAKEDEVKSKVDSITKIYEQKISKMKEKLSRCEDRLRSRGKKSAGDELDALKLELPDVNLCLSPSSLKSKKAAGKEKGEEDAELKKKKKELEEMLREREKRKS